MDSVDRVLGADTSAAVVIVSGGAAISPFTTPTQACRQGLAAGNTDTFLREGLLRAGHQVFTSPAGVGYGQVTEDPGWGGFSDGPEALPADMTVNAVGDIDQGGASLARFFSHLHHAFGVDTVDIVGHSMGGLFSRAAIRELQQAGSPVAVRTLTTIGTPWEGAFSADYVHGDVPLAECHGDPVCEASMRELANLVAASSEGAGEQVTAAYLAGPGGWNERQGGVLDGIPVVTIGGSFYALEGIAQVWPNDGLVALGSAHADGVSERVLPHRVTRTFLDVHSIYFSHLLDLPWERALTWDPDVLGTVVHALEHPERHIG
jgi:triacylglycerol lipase